MIGYDDRVFSVVFDFYGNLCISLLDKFVRFWKSIFSFKIENFCYDD